MTAAGATDVSRAAHAAPLAAPLLRLATHTATTVQPAGLAVAVASLRAFVTEPSPVRYLAAMRALRGAARQQKLAHLTSVAAPRLAVEHLAFVAEAAGLPDDLRELLSLLPPDARTTRRLRVLGQLLTAHGLLAAHAEATLHDLQEHLGQPARPRTPSVDRRRPRR